MLTYEKLTGAFWDSMRKSAVSSELLDMTNDPSRHVCALPRDTATAYTAALAKENLFRRYATTIKAPANSDRIITTDTPVDAEWVAENGVTPEADLNATYLGLEMHMPSAASGSKPIAFGDFSYYWIAEQESLTVRALHEKYSFANKTGYLGMERLDGRLIRSEAIKVLQMAE